MLPNLGQLMNLMKNAGQIKENMRVMQERLSAARFVGEAGAGMVRATVDGRGELLAVKLDPSVASAQDAEMLEDLIVAAVRDAVARSRLAAKQEMETATGMDLGSVMDLLGGNKP